MNRLKNLLVNTKFSNCRTRVLKEGYNNDTLLLEKDGEKFVAHLGKDKKDSGSSLYHAFWSLKFLEYAGIHFVPRIALYDDTNDLLVETFAEGTHIPFAQFDSGQLDTFARQLATIHRLPYADMEHFSKQEGLMLPEVKTALESMHIYGSERFATVKVLCPDQEVVRWIEPKLSSIVAALESETTSDEPLLHWGDIGNNIHIDGDAMWFIDWEFSSISCGHELAYVKIHSHPTEDQFVQLVKIYAEYADVPEDTLYEEIFSEEQRTRLNDVIWSAMKWGEHREDGEKVLHYEELTKKRMRYYDALGIKT